MVKPESRVLDFITFELSFNLAKYRHRIGICVDRKFMGETADVKIFQMAVKLSLREQPFVGTP